MADVEKAFFSKRFSQSVFLKALPFWVFVIAISAVSFIAIRRTHSWKQLAGLPIAIRQPQRIDVQQGQPVELTVPIRSQRDHELTLVGLGIPCSCIEHSKLPVVLQPGGEHLLEIKVDTAGMRPGNKDFDLRVFLSSESSKLLSIPLRLNIVADQRPFVSVLRTDVELHDSD